MRFWVICLVFLMANFTTTVFADEEFPSEWVELSEESNEIAKVLIDSAPQLSGIERSGDTLVFKVEKLVESATVTKFRMSGIILVGGDVAIGTYELLITRVGRLFGFSVVYSYDVSYSENVR